MDSITLTHDAESDATWHHFWYFSAVAAGAGVGALPQSTTVERSMSRRGKSSRKL